MPRNNTAIASAYGSRTALCQKSRGDVWTLQANFNALLTGATISSAIWRTTNANSVIFGTASKSGGTVSVVATAGVGNCNVKCIATLSDARKVTQSWTVLVQSAPWYDGETTPAAGATSATC